MDICPICNKTLTVDCPHTTLDVFNQVRVQAAEIARLRAALKKYANKAWWTNNPNIRMDDSKDIFMDDGDGWEIAEEGLKGGEP